MGPQGGRALLHHQGHRHRCESAPDEAGKAAVVGRERGHQRHEHRREAVGENEPCQNAEEETARQKARERCRVHVSGAAQQQEEDDYDGADDYDMTPDHAHDNYGPADSETLFQNIDLAHPDWLRVKMIN